MEFQHRMGEVTDGITAWPCAAIHIQRPADDHAANLSFIADQLEEFFHIRREFLPPQDRMRRGDLPASIAGRDADGFLAHIQPDEAFALWNGISKPVNLAYGHFGCYQCCHVLTPLCIEQTDMSVDKTTVSRVARLARINIDDDRLEPMAQELSSIMNWIEQLNEVNTDAVEPLASVTGHALPMRDDIVTDGEMADQIVQNAPESMSGFFVVPKVVE